MGAMGAHDGLGGWSLHENTGLVIELGTGEVVGGGVPDLELDGRFERSEFDQVVRPRRRLFGGGLSQRDDPHAHRQHHNRR